MQNQSISPDLHAKSEYPSAATVEFSASLQHLEPKSHKDIVFVGNIILNNAVRPQSLNALIVQTLSTMEI